MRTESKEYTVTVLHGFQTDTPLLLVLILAVCLKKPTSDDEQAKVLISSSHSRVSWGNNFDFFTTEASCRVPK